MKSKIDSFKGRIHIFEARVGKAMRLARIMKDITQYELGECIEVTSQQIQKYEKGENRLSAGRLFVVAKFLDLPLDFFFRSFEADWGDEDDPGYDYDNDALTLARVLLKIKDPLVKEKLLELTKSLSTKKTCAVR